MGLGWYGPGESCCKADPPTDEYMAICIDNDYLELEVGDEVVTPLSTFIPGCPQPGNTQTVYIQRLLDGVLFQIQCGGFTVYERFVVNPPINICYRSSLKYTNSSFDRTLWVPFSMRQPRPAIGDIDKMECCPAFVNGGSAFALPNFKFFEDNYSTDFTDGPLPADNWNILINPLGANLNTQPWVGGISGAGAFRDWSVGMRFEKVYNYEQGFQDQINPLYPFALANWYADWPEYKVTFDSTIYYETPPGIFQYTWEFNGIFVTVFRTGPGNPVEYEQRFGGVFMNNNPVPSGASLRVEVRLEPADDEILGVGYYFFETVSVNGATIHAEQGNGFWDVDGRFRCEPTVQTRDSVTSTFSSNGVAGYDSFSLSLVRI